MLLNMLYDQVDQQLFAMAGDLLRKETDSDFFVTYLKGKCD